MTVIQEVYIESVWEEAEAVRQRRDARYAELQASGLECHREDLYTVDLRRVFVVTATPIEVMAPKQSRQTEYGRSRPGGSGESKGERSLEFPLPRRDLVRRGERSYEER